MADSHPYEGLLKERFHRVKMLFRAPAGLLAWVTEAEEAPWKLVRLALPEDKKVGKQICAAITDYVGRAEFLEYPGLLWPTAHLCDSGLPALVYEANHQPSTLAEFVLFEGKGWTLERLLGQLIPVAQGLDALHRAKRVHGAVAPVTILVEKLDEVLLTRLFDVSAWKLFEPLEPREVLGAGPSPRRRTPPNFASDVRAFGHVLLWIHAVTQSSESSIEGNWWPQDLIELTRRCTRKRPVRTLTVVQELTRIVAEWDRLKAGEAVDDFGPLNRDSGAFHGILLNPDGVVEGEELDDAKDTRPTEAIGEAAKPAATEPLEAIEHSDAAGSLPSSERNSAEPAEPAVTEPLEAVAPLDQELDGGWSLEASELEDALGSEEHDSKDTDEPRDTEELTSIAPDTPEDFVPKTKAEVEAGASKPKDEAPGELEPPEDLEPSDAEDAEDVEDAEDGKDDEDDEDEEEDADDLSTLQSELEAAAPPEAPHVPPPPAKRDDDAPPGADGDLQSCEPEGGKPDPEAGLAEASTLTVTYGDDSAAKGPEAWIPAGEVIVTRHVLKPDRMCKDEEEVEEGDGFFLLLLGLFFIILLIGVTIWTAVHTAELTLEVAARPSGEERLVIHAGVIAAHYATTEPNADLLASCTDQSGTVLDLQTGEVVSRFWPGSDGCTGLSFEPGGERLFIKTHSGALEVFNLLEARPSRKTIKSTAAGVVLSFKTIASTRFLFDEVVDGQRRLRTGEHTLSIPNDAKQCTGGGPHSSAFAVDNSITLLEPHALRPIGTLSAAGEVQSCAIGPDGVRVAAVVTEFGVQHWRTADRLGEPAPLLDWKRLGQGSREVQLTFGDTSGSLAIAFGSELAIAKPVFAVVENKGNIAGFSTDRGDRVLAYHEDTDKVALLANGSLHYLPASEGSLSVPTNLTVDHPTVAFGADGSSIFSVHQRSRYASMLVKWSLAKAEIEILTIDGAVDAIAVSPNGLSLALASKIEGKTRVSLVNVSDAMAMVDRKEIDGSVETLEWSTSGSYLLVRTRFKASQLFSVDNQQLQPLGAFEHELVTELYRDDLLLIWGQRGLEALELPAEEHSAPLIGLNEVEGSVLSIEASPFARGIVLRTREKVYWFELESHTLVELVSVSKEPPTVAFSPFGGAFTMGARSYDSHTGVPGFELEGADAYQEVIWSGDGATIMAWPLDGTIWDALDGRRIRTGRDGDAQSTRTSVSLHPSSDLLVRARDGVISVETALEQRPILLALFDSKDEWLLADETNFAGTALDNVALSDGFASVSSAESRSSKPALIARAAALNLEARRPTDPFSGKKPLELPRMVSISIRSNPPGAEVALLREGQDETVLGATPLDLEMKNSREEMTILIRKDGFADSQTSMVPLNDVEVVATLVDSRTFEESQKMRIEGPIEQDEVLALVILDRHRLDRCIAMDQWFPAMQGEVDGRIVISAAGEVQSVQFLPEALPLAVSQCLETIMGDWRFEHQATGSVVSYHLSAP
ncbi:MAG: hypothetical protein CO108_00350 [Deltaproteobacteria bacterium CG_4_9_14_3_um_filter_63_12]|nr:MAG: hypothetical protein CO108_00350 [Deltaproteobacteria bacterium CG_4_9_14_3_um_filter_63_12]